jgi:hypothetical protein
MLAITLIITLLPFQFEWPRAWRLAFFGEPLDIAANVLLFVPLGFLYRLTQPPARRRSTAVVFTVAALASGAIEVAQLFEPTRTASVFDVAANAAGAWLGALAFDRIARAARVDGRLVGWLALELPLMGLVYLLVPLLWISSLASQGAPARVVMTALLGVFGAILLGGMQRHYFGPARASTAPQTAAFAALWFVAGAFPLLAWRPFELAAAALGVALLCAWQGRARGTAAGNRRFEVPLLKAGAPAYAAYLALTTIAPLIDSFGSWTFAAAFPEAASHQVEILRLIELGAAHTLVGYMVAEVCGRELPEYAGALARLLAWALALTAFGEVLRGYQIGHGASGLRAVLLVGATFYGGWLYYLQRAHIVRLLSSGAPSAETQSGRQWPQVTS